MLQELFDNEEDFFTFGLRKSREHKAQSEVLAPAKQKEFAQSVKDSIARQADIEASDDVSFKEFLDAYHAQLK